MRTGALLFAAGAALFAPILGFEFLSWDDQRYVVGNPTVHGFSARNLARAFGEPIVANYVPLALVSYQLDWSLWGAEPLGFHLQSLLWHGLCAALAGWAARELSGSRRVGLFAGLLFAWHPSHVESVAWISGRKDLLATAFGLGALLAHLRGRLGLAVGLFALALLSKVSVALLPLAFWLAGRAVPRAVWLAYGALAGVAVVANQAAQATARAAYASDPLHYLGVKAHALWVYAQLLLGLRVGHPSYELPDLSGAAGLAAAGAGLALGLGACALPLRAARRERPGAAAVGVAWLAAGLAPALAFPLVTHMADRYLYLPSFGFCLLLGLGLERIARRRAAGLRVAAGALAALSLLYVVQTARALPVWRSSDAFWSHVAATTSGSRGRIGLAGVRIEQGRFAEAEALLLQVPGASHIARDGALAEARRGQGRLDEAIAGLERAARAYAESVGARSARERRVLAGLHLSRAQLLLEAGEAEAALAALRDAREIDPEHAGARRLERRLRRRGVSGGGPG